MKGEPMPQKPAALRLRYATDPLYAAKKRESARLAYAQRREIVLAKLRDALAADPDGTRATARRSYARRKEKIRSNARAYRQTHAARLRTRDRAYHTANKEMRTAQSRASYAKHAEKRRKESLMYKQLHPERNAEAHQRRRASKACAPLNDLTAVQWESIKQQFGYRCAYCDRKMQRLTQDHITPLSKGGSHTMSNIVPACKSC